MYSSGTILANILQICSQAIPRDPVSPTGEVPTARLVRGDYAWLSHGIIKFFFGGQAAAWIPDSPFPLPNPAAFAVLRGDKYGIGESRLPG